MLKRMSAALAVAGAMAIGGSGVAIADGADDPAGHEQHHHRQGKHHHHHRGDHRHGNDDGPNHH